MNVSGSVRSLAKKKLPSYLLHKPTGQARVRIDGRDHYLGEYVSDQSRVRYGTLVARIASGQLPVDPMAKLRRQAFAADHVDLVPSVSEICLSFWSHAQTHYIKNGKPTSEIHCYRSCLKVLRELYGMIPAKDFGPLALKAVRAKMVELGWARTNINTMAGRIRRIFKHAVENEMIDVAVLTRLQSVAPLLSGRTEAHDNAPRHAVDQDQIEAVRQRVQPLVRDLIDVQLHTGARSGELLSLTTAMINRTGEVWKAALVDHKCQHHGQSRTLHFGPQSQLILSKYLSADPEKRLFAITRCAYCRAVTRGCELAFGMPDNLRKIDKKLSHAKQVEYRRLASEWRSQHCWSPHWLRHTAATRIREQLGIENVQSMLGHSDAEMSRHYSAKMDKLAASTAAAVG